MKRIELNYKLITGQVVIFSVTQIHQNSCHILADKKNNQRGGRGKHEKGRREKQIEGREGVLLTCHCQKQV